MDKTTAWVQDEAKGQLTRKDFSLKAGPGDAIVQVTACGVCHTDVGFWDGSVKPRGGFPLVLGHEASGIVKEAADKSLIGKQVVIPSVWPCGECGPCKAGRETACLKQKMPGNDVPGAFAGHVVVPARCLAPVPKQVSTEQLQQMSVTADAIATPMEAVIRSGLKAGDYAVVVGTGGLGSFMVQLARIRGAKVVAIDVNDVALNRAKEYGATATVNVTGLSDKDVKGKVKGLAKELGATDWGWKIFETSGTTPGQKTAYDLLGPAATLMVVGYTPNKLELRLSNLMAFDASALGVWGSTPKALTEAVDLVANGKITIAPFVELRSMKDVNEVLHLAHDGKLNRRVVLLPE